ncbi:hypothetical protein A8C32_07550 [Flavivirga aquatica]|uniref:SMP-30/Gluconolactonase/LRE-like region domain-containing protein n=1 Tax=Flavivirga aquatica TaxID=1849968 RepID=A0A1E5SIT1_9FLAO|nr:SMP-30/gluconolactonase/LRE family protein [Flavivirga aquatica]OEJ99023.1 hypothetical protein A8C32_07550 [Flavivirga aquatica]
MNFMPLARSKYQICFLSLTMLFQVSCKTSGGIHNIPKILPQQIITAIPGQNPEGIEYNKNKNVFYLSAINKTPSIASVNFEGQAKTFSNDSELKSKASFGLQIDYNNNRLLACTNKGKSGNVHIYSLSTGKLEHTINVSSLSPKSKKHQANDLVVSPKNIIFVTGRLENIIYKINKQLKPSVFFKKEGFNKPNGIVYHPDGYLLVTFTNKNSKLVKIPVNNPNDFKIIDIKNFDFNGCDGMILNEKGHIVAVGLTPEGKTTLALELASNDQWETATVINKKTIKRSTTITQVRQGTYYVINQDWKNRNAEKWILEKVEF